MGSCGRNEEWTGGVTGADAEIGALVWVRRRNGSWWPGRILGQDELPANCVVPPRSAGTPIKLLGRPDGSIDWYNLEKSKRVKAFRCGEYEECIEKAKVLARQQKRTYNEGKYVRREDAIMHALEIEKSRFPDENMMNDSVDASQNSYSAKSKNISSLNKRSSRIARDLYDIEENSAQGLSQALSLFKQPQNISSSSTRYASSSRKKQKAAKDFQDDTVLGSQRMRDLREIGSNMVPKQKSSSGIFSNGHQAVPLLESGSSFGYDLYGTDGIKKSKETHPSTKRKRSNIGQAYENSRKKDRLRPLSKLCNDSVLTVRTYGHWDTSGQPSVQYPGHTLSNVFEPNRGKSAFSMDVNNCSNSSDTSSVETSVDASFTNHNSAVKSIEVKVAEVSCMTGFLNDDCSDGEDFFDAPFALEDDVLDEGHFCTHESYASVKGQISKPKKQAVEYGKECTPSFHDHRSSKKKSISSVNRVAQESHNRDKNLLMQQHERTAKCEALERDVAMDARAESASFCKRNGLENNMQLAIVSADGFPGVLEQKYHENAPEHDESSETISNHSHSEKGAGASPYYGMPLQVIPPEEKPDLKHAGCHVVKPIKGVCADYKIYNIQLAVQGTYKGHRVPLVSLMSKWNGKPIVGFPIPVEVLDGIRPAAIRCYPVPVEVEVLDGSRPAASTYDHHPATSSLDHLRKSSEVVEPRQARSNASRSKPSGRKKIPEHEIDKSWRPHTKKSACSPRKMRRLSSFASNRRESANRKPVIGKISGPTIACIPLRLVFSRINEALTFPVRSENPN